MPSRSTAEQGSRVVTDGVSRVHPGPVVAVADVSLTLEPGEFVALTGPSGSGKTSLLSLIGALDRPTSGTVDVDDERVSEASGAALARYHRETVGFVFQHHHLLAHLTPVANVELALIGAGVPRGVRRERARELLEEVGLSHRAEALIPHLSGGERQRVALARALANDPSLLLADEPTGSLDSDAAAQVLELIEDVRRRRGTTVLIVTHDAQIAGRADRVLHMRDGRVGAAERGTLRVEQLGA
jgi:ABC-type lipoprotein export system ATPase subunit